MMRNAIKSDNLDHNYFVLTPHVVLALCRNPFNYTLWNVINMIAGEDDECVLSTGELATLVGCSRHKIVNTRGHRLTVGLITGERRYEPGHPQPIWRLSIPAADLWQRNVAWRIETATQQDYVDAVKKSRRLPA